MTTADIVGNDWDVLIIGDGSGSSWDIGCGWASVLFQKHQRTRKLFYGSMSCGTSMIAEVMPYLQAMQWFQSTQAKALRETLHKPIIEVSVISDNQTVVRQGNKEIQAGKLSPFWSAWRNLMSEGYRDRFYHLGRQTHPVNALCDYISGQSRLSIQALTLEKMLPGDEPFSLYSICPDL